MEGMASIPVDKLIKMNDAMRAFDENKIMLAGHKWYYSNDPNHYEQEIKYIGKDEALIKMQSEINRLVDLLNKEILPDIDYNTSFRSRLHFLFTGRLN